MGTSIPASPLARKFEDKKLDVAATVIYRALMESILSRAVSKIYPHAARYWRHLEKLSSVIGEWGDVVPHDEYVALLRTQHRLKSSFWKLVDG